MNSRRKKPPPVDEEARSLRAKKPRVLVAYRENTWALRRPGRIVQSTNLHPPTLAIPHSPPRAYATRSLFPTPLMAPSGYPRRSLSYLLFSSMAKWGEEERWTPYRRVLSPPSTLSASIRESINLVQLA